MKYQRSILHSWISTFHFLMTIQESVISLVLKSASFKRQVRHKRWSLIICWPSGPESWHSIHVYMLTISCWLLLLCPHIVIVVWTLDDQNDENCAFMVLTFIPLYSSLIIWHWGVGERTMTDDSCVGDMRRVLCIIWSLGWTLHEGNDEHLPILVTHTHRYLPQLPYQNNIQHANTHSRYHPYPSRHTFTAIIYGNGQHQPIDTLHNYHIRTTCGHTLALQARGGLESESCIKLLIRERIGGSLVSFNHVQVSF